MFIRNWFGTKPETVEKAVTPEETKIPDRPSICFTDGKTKIDYVLCYETATMQNDKKRELIVDYVQAVNATGLLIEVDNSEVLDKVVFLKIHAPDKVLNHFVNFYHIDLAKDNPLYGRHTYTDKCFQTELTKWDEGSEIYKRAYNTVTRVKPVTYTSAERSWIVRKVLICLNISRSNDVWNIDKLLKKSIFHSMYPINDGTYKWSIDGPLNDRQLLYRYWGSLLQFFKVQPIDIVQKYYGSEMAFYFAFIGLLNKMFLIASILGLVAFGIGFVNFIDPEWHEFCELKDTFCPSCIVGNLGCEVRNMEAYCALKFIALMFDNLASVANAMIMPFWALAFAVLWKRTEASLKMEWNLNVIDLNVNIRPEYRSAHTKVSRFTQQEVETVSMGLKVFGRIISLISIILLIAVIPTFVFLLMLYQQAMEWVLITYNRTEWHIYISISTAIINGVFIIAVNPLILELSERLTVLEYHRTEQEHEDAVRLKYSAMSIPTHFGVLFYLALFKGKFVINPEDLDRMSKLGVLPFDHCYPDGCMRELSIHVMVILTIRGVCHVFGLLIPGFIQMLQARFTFGGMALRYALKTRWEKDFLKTQVPRNNLIVSYRDDIMRFGMVVGFTAACPLLPLIALLTQLVKLRTQAFMYMRVHQRYPAVVGSGIGFWYGLLLSMIFLGSLTNVLVVAFASSFISRMLYLMDNHWTLKGYIAQTFTKAELKKYTEAFNMQLSKEQLSKFPEKCYYRSHQMGNQDGVQQGIINYWRQTTVQLVFTLTFWCILLALMGIILYAVPKKPLHVRLREQEEEMRLREARIRTLNQEYSPTIQTTQL